MNSVATATPCSLNDVEICYKGIHEIYTINEDGHEEHLKETYGDESYPAYYYCNGCQQDWVINVMQSQEQAWELVKEHLNAA